MTIHSSVVDLIGRTPLTLFAAARTPACLLAPGDLVRFRTITANDFVRLARNPT